MTDRDLDGRRIGHGFAAAILTATGLAAMASLLILPALVALVAVVAFFVASGHALVVGVPAYLLLSRVWRIGWWQAVLGGAAVAAGPFTILNLAHGFADDWAISAWLALIGAPAGYAFWRSVRRPTTGERSST